MKILLITSADTGAEPRAIKDRFSLVFPYLPYVYHVTLEWVDKNGVERKQDLDAFHLNSQNAKWLNDFGNHERTVMTIYCRLPGGL